MADAVSRSGTSLGTLVIVPAAGVTHAASGIGEAFLDGIPMLVIAGGIRRDTGRTVPAARHGPARAAEADHQGHLAGRAARGRDPDDLRGGARRHQRRTRAGVRRDSRCNLQLLTGDEGPVRRARRCTVARPTCAAPRRRSPRRRELLRNGQVARRSSSAGAPSMRRREVAALAERLGAPVATTLQGLSAFPANHPLHAGFCLGRAAVPAVENAFARLRLHARRRHALRRDRDRQLRLRRRRRTWSTSTSIPHVFGANYPAPRRARRRCAAPCCAAARRRLRDDAAAAERARGQAVAARIARTRRPISRSGCATIRRAA